MNNLLNRTLIILIFSSLIIVGVTSSLQFFWIKQKIEKRVDRTLKREKKLIKEQIKDIQPETGFSYNTNRASVKFISNSIQLSNDSIYNGIMIEDGEKINYRILNTFLEVGGQNYKVEIRKELEETNTFIESLYFTFLITLILVILMFILFKYFLLKNTWLPFFKTLKQLKDSDLQNNLTKFSETVNIKEFNDLNKELNEIANRIYYEYQGQKKFIENLNHELMTPLAIIKTKLELIIQSENLNENDLKLISSIFDAIDRLTKLNQSLILISKIENNQFEEVEKVSIDECINDVLNSFEDQIRIQKISIRKQIKSKVILDSNEMLMFVLLSNLIKNAIFHNYAEDGIIDIILKDDYLVIKNTGAVNELNQLVFERFKTSKKHGQSLGLGLSIVKHICILYKFKIAYHQDNNLHTVTLNFNSSELLQN